MSLAVTIQCPPNQTVVQVANEPSVVVTQPVSQTIINKALNLTIHPAPCPPQQIGAGDCAPGVVEVVVPGPPGPQGEPGISAGSTPYISGTSAEFTPMFKGTPVALVAGQFRRATSLAPFNEVIGLVMDDVIVPGAAGRVQTAGPLEQPTPEWEVVTGLPGGLSPGALHFPSNYGSLTPFAPTTQGEFVVPTGRAASPTTFIIDIDTQVQL